MLMYEIAMLVDEDLDDCIKIIQPNEAEQILNEIKISFDQVPIVSDWLNKLVKENVKNG